MVIHETTHRIAPLSIDRNMVGQELPILASASGLAYIAFAPKEERQSLLALLAQSNDPYDAVARDTTQLSHLIAATGAIALPIRVGRRLLGCINTVWMARALLPTAAVNTCLGPLRETREVIERRLAEARRQ